MRFDRERARERMDSDDNIVSKRRWLEVPQWLPISEVRSYEIFREKYFELISDEKDSYPLTLWPPEDVALMCRINYNSNVNSRFYWLMYLCFLIVYRERLLGLYGVKYVDVDTFLSAYPELSESWDALEAKGYSVEYITNEQKVLWAEANWMSLFLSHFGPRNYKRGLVLATITKFTEGINAMYVTGSGQKLGTSLRLLVYQKEGGLAYKGKEISKSKVPASASRVLGRSKEDNHVFGPGIGKGLGAGKSVARGNKGGMKKKKGNLQSALAHNYPYSSLASSSLLIAVGDGDHDYPIGDDGELLEPADEQSFPFLDEDDSVNSSSVNSSGAMQNLTSAFRPVRQLKILSAVPSAVPSASASSPQAEHQLEYQNQRYHEVKRERKREQCTLDSLVCASSRPVDYSSDFIDTDLCHNGEEAREGEGQESTTIPRSLDPIPTSSSSSTVPVASEASLVEMEVEVEVVDAAVISESNVTVVGEICSSGSNSSSFKDGGGGGGGYKGGDSERSNVVLALLQLQGREGVGDGAETGRKTPVNEEEYENETTATTTLSVNTSTSTSTNDRVREKGRTTRESPRMSPTERESPRMPFIDEEPQSEISKALHVPVTSTTATTTPSVGASASSGNHSSSVLNQGRINVAAVSSFPASDTACDPVEWQGLQQGHEVLQQTQMEVRTTRSSVFSSSSSSQHRKQQLKRRANDDNSRGGCGALCQSQPQSKRARSGGSGDFDCDGSSRNRGQHRDKSRSRSRPGAAKLVPERAVRVASWGYDSMHYVSSDDSPTEPKLPVRELPVLASVTAAVSPAKSMLCSSAAASGEGAVLFGSLRDLNPSPPSPAPSSGPGPGPAHIRSPLSSLSVHESSRRGAWLKETSKAKLYSEVEALFEAVMVAGGSSSM